MGRFDEFYDAKDYIINLIKTEIVGPVKEDEVLDAKPLDTYVSGILWAQPIRNLQAEDADDEADYEKNSMLVDGQVFDEDEETGVPQEVEIEEIDDGTLVKTAKRKPSTMGISLMLDEKVSKAKVTFSFGKYTHSEEEREYGDEGKTRKYFLYTRKGYQYTLTFDFSKDKIVYEAERSEDCNLLEDMNISIQATKRLGKLGEKRLVTFSVSNNNYAQSKDIVLNENALFQCVLSINATDGEFAPLDPGYSSSFDLEDEILAMQYKDVLNFAQGHGCATAWELEGSKCKTIMSEFVPVYEVKQMKPPAVQNQKLFSLKYLYSGNRLDIIKELNEFTDLYHSWFTTQQSLANSPDYSDYKKAIAYCFGKIKECEKRIREGIRVLSYDDNAWSAFVYANKAMYYQQISMALMNEEIKDESEFEDKKGAHPWYPFQLFYLLMIIPDFATKNSPYKDVVDLLWFPTGGGKTEAYLAVSAFIIFYERLTKKRTSYGTTILMRYTLRLLTIQQFERASAMICACDRVRRENSLGGNRISIGLWIGSGSTPNNIDEAQESLQKLINGEKLYEHSNPVQITKCPYCGKKLTAVHYAISNNRMRITCPDCGELPIHIVDTDIYEAMPTLVISTVDKFARIVWEEKSGRLFGCNVDTNKPRLIIQDELHLISGPLGTLTGLYEAAVDRLCWDNGGNKPKIIASTATVKNAAYQIKGLYNRAHFQFPPNGLDHKDSFFAEQATKDDRPSRYYVGLSEQGGSMVDLMIRVFSALSIIDYYMKEEGRSQKVIDQYYTIIGYFNAIKDLGTASTVIRERMYSYITSLLNGKFNELSKKLGIDQDDKGKYVFDMGIKHGELTSRRTSTEIKSILDDLKISYQVDPDQEQAFKYVLSSNMFSVGVDINRLGLMAVYGQPKSNADYIQATSRVGRSNPGIVFCMYNAFRTRDRSYYERFTQYHSCFYKYVEATSVTPFSSRSIEKGLHSVFIALIRHLIPGMENNDGAALFTKSSARIEVLKEYLLSRIADIQPDSLQYSKDYLDAFIEYWDQNTQSLVYDKKKKGRQAESFISLLASAENGSEDFSVLNSVRNVENSSNVYVDMGEL